MVKEGEGKGFIGEKTRNGRSGTNHVLLSRSEFFLKVSGSIQLLVCTNIGGMKKIFFL